MGNVLPVGFGNFIMASRVIAVTSYNSAPTKRLVEEKIDKGMCVDATFGRKTRSVIYIDSGQIVLSSVQPSALETRVDVKQQC